MRTTIVAVKSLLAGEYTLVSTAADKKKTKMTTRNRNNTLLAAGRQRQRRRSSQRRGRGDPTTPPYSPSRSPRSRRRPNYNNTLVRQQQQQQQRPGDGDNAGRRRTTANTNNTHGQGGAISTTPTAAAVVVGGGGNHHHHHQQQQTTTTHPSDEDPSDSSSENEEDNEEDETASTYSAGLSTRTGDSFVLQIDWNHTTTSSASAGYYHDTEYGRNEYGNLTTNNNGLNDSLEDPYLPKLESIRRRLLGARKQQSPSPKVDKGVKEEKASRQPLATIQPEVAVAVAATEATNNTSHPNKAMTTSSSPPPAKSLGTFAFPDNDNDDVLEDAPSPPTHHLSVPRQPNFGPSNISSVLEEEEEEEDDSDDEEGSDDYDDSFDDLPIGTTIPSVPTTQPSARSASRRKRRHAAVQKSRAIREALHQLQQESPSTTITTRSPLMLIRKKQHEHDGDHQHQQLKKAKLYLELGRSEQTARRYLSAINAFFQAAAIYRRYSSDHRHHHHRTVALATALDHAAVAYCQAQKNNASTMNIIHRQHKRTRFVHCLHEALQIRRHELGPWHVDTVDTLQHLAQLHLLSGGGSGNDIGLACTYFLEVVQLRQAIFGPHHPSTAVAAHCLGNAYLRSHDPVAAEIWYENALQIYNIMELPNANPAVQKLLHDRHRVQRVSRWMTETNPADDENLLFEL